LGRSFLRNTVFITSTDTQTLLQGISLAAEEYRRISYCIV
jgi:hypothetical protein